ncbi:flavin reductase family protein [Photobacterium sp. R1]
MNIDVSTMAPSHIYHLMTQTIVPRPVAWVLTDAGDANYNLAPFSYFTAVSSNPPLLMLSVGKKPNGDIKDTTRNVMATGRLVIHIAPTELGEQVTATSATLDHRVSEVETNQIELAEFEGFDLPRVAACPVAFGCTLFEIKEIGNTPQSLIFAEIEQIYLDENMIDRNSERLKIDALKLDPISRLGGSEYARLGDVFTVKRPD